METLNEIDLMIIGELVDRYLMEVEKAKEDGTVIDYQKEFDVRTLKRKMALMRMQKRV